MDRNKALELARELISEGRSTWDVKFPIEGAGDEDVVVLVRRRRGLLEKKAWDNTVSLQPSGPPCPRCGGSGRA